MNVLWSFAV